LEAGFIYFAETALLLHATIKIPIKITPRKAPIDIPTICPTDNIGLKHSSASPVEQL
jgi:hypothetical protein